MKLLKNRFDRYGQAEGIVENIYPMDFKYILYFGCIFGCVFSLQNLNITIQKIKTSWMKGFKYLNH